MARKLDTATLDQAARDYRDMFVLPDARTISGLHWKKGPKRIQQDFFNFRYKDEFDYVMERFRGELDKYELSRFDDIVKMHFTPRDEATLERELAEWQAVDLNGDHIEGKIGRVEVGRRVVGRGSVLMRRPIVRPLDPANPAGEWHITGYRERIVQTRQEWPIYRGEGEERAIGSKVPDKLPDTTEALPVGANVTTISEESCRAGIDAVAAKLDEGDAAAEIRGRTGTQPDDPDASETGTLLFSLGCSDPAILAAVDDTDGSCSALFDTIADDAEADDSGTVVYCRAAATGAGADNHLDGNAATSDAAYVFDTVSILAGATVSVTSAVLGQSQGSTAS